MATIISMSTSLVAAEFSMGIQRNDMEERSDVTGVRAGRVLGPPQWTYHIVAPRLMSLAQAALWKTMLLGLDGLNNYLAAFNLVETAPRGTMRGTMTLSGAHSAGATSATITAGAGQASTTLLAGDWLQIGTGLTGQLVMVTGDATANGSGVITVNFKHPLRNAQSGGASVNWDRALGHYRLLTPMPTWQYPAGVMAAQGGFALDFVEQW